MNKIIEIGVIPVYSEKRNQMLFGYKANIEKQTMFAKCIDFDVLFNDISNENVIIKTEELKLSDFSGIPFMDFAIDDVEDEKRLLSIALFAYFEVNGGKR